MSAGMGQRALPRVILGGKGSTIWRGSNPNEQIFAQQLENKAVFFFSVAASLFRPRAKIFAVG